MTKSIIGFNDAARRGKDVATTYCQLWRSEITKESTVLANELVNKKIDKNTYNFRRERLNKSTKDLNDCIASLNKLAK